jgi:hypothetical protein
MCFRNKLVGVLVTGSTLLGGVAIAVGADQSGRSALGAADVSQWTAKEAIANPSNSPVASVDPDQAAAFALLRTAPEAVPDEVRLDIEQSTFYQAFGLNLDLAQGVLTPASSVPEWIIPGDGFLCIWMKDPGDGAAISCDPTDVAIRHGLIVTLVRPGDPKITVAGLAADGTTSVVVDGGTSKLTPRSGAFGARDIEARLLSFNGSGAVRLARPTKTDVFGHTTEQ